MMQTTALRKAGESSDNPEGEGEEFQNNVHQHSLCNREVKGHWQ